MDEAEIPGMLRLPLCRTTTFIYKEPLARDGFTLANLEANTKYDVKIRTHSGAGTSLPSQSLTVETAPPDNPGGCLFFSIDYDVELADECSSFGLRWTKPLRYGGCPIVECVRILTSYLVLA